MIHTSGDVINSGEDTWSFDQFLPKLTAEYRQFDVSISTVNNRCDITEKAELTGSAAAKLIKVAGLVTLWTKTFHERAPEVTLGPCRPPGPCGTEPAPSPDSMSEPSYECTDVPPSPGGGGGGGGGETVTWIEITTCYYTDYYDGYGNLTHSVLDYCTSTTFYY